MDETELTYRLSQVFATVIVVIIVLALFLLLFDLIAIFLEIIF